MRARHFSRYFFGAVLILAGLATASGGCSRQTEGERCDDKTGDTDDCDAGLVCTPCDQLGTLDVPRCCPPEGSDYSDPRCRPTNGGTCSLTPSGSGGEAGTPGEGATSSGAAANEAGMAGQVSSASGGAPGVSGAGGESGATPVTGGSGGAAAGEGGSGGAAAGEGGTQTTSAGSGGA